MKKKAKLVLVYVLLAFLFSGCTSVPATIPSATITPVPSDAPVSTSTSVPTETPVSYRVDAPVYGLALQADGKIIVSAGCSINPLTWTEQPYITRLNPDGTLDATFNPKLDGTPCERLALQADGKILVGGRISDRVGENYIARINPDGTLDTVFDPGASGGRQSPAAINELAVQSDGKIIVTGNFSKLGGQPHDEIARLNPDGTLDTSFNPGTLGAVFVLAVQPDGRIVVGGLLSRSNLARLNPDGTLDAAFNLGTRGAVFGGPKVSIWPEGNGAVKTLALQADGKIVVGGNFATLGNSPCCGIARLNPDGTLDTAFAPGTDWPVSGLRWLVDAGGITKFAPGMNGPVRALAIQADGKIVVGGEFTGFTGFPEGGAWTYAITRLNPDGTLDILFNQQTAEQIAGTVNTLVVQPDGKIVVGGDLTFGRFLRDTETTRYYILRLNPDGTLDTTFNP
jgi:uncharacterized delta-60 repeat protein